MYICTKESVSFDTEALFPFEGIEDTDATNQLHQWSSEEGSDTDGTMYCIIIIYRFRSIEIQDCLNFNYFFRFKPE